MALFFIFFLGIANFAMHKAVLHSGHPLLGHMPGLFNMMGGRFGLVIEFFMLLTTMLFIDGGATGWAWAYAGYSLLNGLSAWLILSGRV